MIRTYQDAMDFLHIADNAFDAQAYDESAEIVQKVARYAAYESKGLSREQQATLTEAVQRLIGRFTFCPDECLWEEVSALSDMFPD